MVLVSSVSVPPQTYGAGCPNLAARPEIDAAGLTFADSAGLRALLVAHSDAGQRGVTLRLSRVSEQLDRLLEMTGLRETLVGVA
jgi:anti-anti-sigma factor